MGQIRQTRKCYDCKQEFRKEEMVEYASAKATVAHWYCPACLQKKQDREMFSDRVCEIFGIKGPGPRIWTERKRLQDTYGYTDSVIIDCLDYIYNVKHYKKLSESLVLVKPQMVDEMKKWKRGESNKLNGLLAAMAQPVEHVQVEVQENTHSNKKIINADDFLDD